MPHNKINAEPAKDNKILIISNLWKSKFASNTLNETILIMHRNYPMYNLHGCARFTYQNYSKANILLKIKFPLQNAVWSISI